MTDQAPETRSVSEATGRFGRGHPQKPQRVWDTYMIQDGVITALGPPGEPSKEYYPLECPALPFELSRVPDGDDQAALAFIQRWGSLGFSTLGGVDMGFPEACAVGAIGIDPLWFIWGHAYTIKNILKMWKALQTVETVAKLDNVVAEIPVNVPAWIRSHILKYEQNPDYHLQNRFVHLMFWWMEGVDPKHDYVLGLQEERRLPMEVALQFIASSISANLQGIRPSIGLITDESERPETVPVERLRSIYEWRALVQVAYLHLATLVSRKRPIVQCKECGQFFEQKDGRQEFCPPSEDDRAEFKEGKRTRAQSRCGLRNRMRQYRNNSREQKQI